MTEHTGGTVRYHRADWVGDVDPNFPWRVQFTLDDGPVAFTAEQGEAMGLTPPEPASKAFNVVLDELVVVDPHDDITREQVAESIVYMLEVAGLLRDARQDPQPASDAVPEPDASDTLDFDAMPVGTVAEVTLLDGDRLLALKDGDGPDYKWYVGDSSVVDITRLRDVRVVYLPAPVSPAEGLRAVLAGRDDADRMLALPRTWSSVWMDVIAAAAREVHG